MEKLTEKWSDVNFEELEERLELGYCEKKYCSVTYATSPDFVCTTTYCADKYAW